MPYRAKRTKDGIWTVIYFAGPGAYAEIQRCAKRRDAIRSAESSNDAESRMKKIMAAVDRLTDDELERALTLKK